MKTKKNLIFSFAFAFWMLLAAIPAGAVNLRIDEASLSLGLVATTIHKGPDNRLFIRDDGNQMWAVNPASGAYQHYTGLGGDNLADIAFESSIKLWWTDNGVNFGTFNLSTNQQQTWENSLTIPSGDLFNLGPVGVYGDYIWLPSFWGPQFGIFRFSPASDEICLYAYDYGLNASDLVELGGYLWTLDWAKDYLMKFDPDTSNHYRYTLGGGIAGYQKLLSDGSQLWWSEAHTGGDVIVSFDPSSKGTVTYDLSDTTDLYNISLHGGEVWYTDENGVVGRLDPDAAAGTSSTLTETSYGTITPECETLSDPSSATLSPASGTFSWTDGTVSMSEIKTGLKEYALPSAAVPWGIAGVGDFILVSDNGRQKLLRLPTEDQPVDPTQVTVTKLVNNQHGGTAQPDDFQLTLGGDPVDSGVAVPVSPGTYVISETLLSGYTFDGIEGDCTMAGSTIKIDVAAGESKECILKNDDTQSYITVTKVVKNTNEGSAKPDDFQLTLGGSPVNSGVAVPVNPGTYVIGETLLSGYAFDGIDGDCYMLGSTIKIDVSLGESKTCTLTNSDMADGSGYFVFLPLITK